MPEINDLQIYNQRMAAGMEDKMWFVHMVCSDVRVIVDYGCADGTLLSLIHRKYPHLILIGVDNNADMLRMAKKNVPSGIFYSVNKFKDVRLNFGNAALILSSVIHEIFTYEKDPISVTNGLLTQGFKYIAIRDMMLSEDVAKQTSDPFDFVAVKEKSDANMLHEFENIYGDVNNKENLIHFLLKYRYVENWDREVREDYFPWTLESFLRCVIIGTYQLEHLDHYTLPYLKDIIKKDFDIDLNEKTHVKLLLKKV